MRIKTIRLLSFELVETEVRLDGVIKTYNLLLLETLFGVWRREVVKVVPVPEHVEDHYRKQWAILLERSKRVLWYDNRRLQMNRVSLALLFIFCLLIWSRLQ